MVSVKVAYNIKIGGSDIYNIKKVDSTVPQCYLERGSQLLLPHQVHL